MRSEVDFTTTLVLIYAVVGALLLSLFGAALVIRRRVKRSGEMEAAWVFRLRRLTLMSVAILGLLGMLVPVVGLALDWMFYFYLAAIGVGTIGVVVVRGMDE